MAQSLKRVVLHRAAELLGGAARLRELLGASEDDFAAWYSGEADPPEPAFLGALGVVLDDLEERFGA